MFLLSCTQQNTGVGVEFQSNGLGFNAPQPSGVQGGSQRFADVRKRTTGVN